VVLAPSRRFDEALWRYLRQVFLGGLPPVAFAALRGLPGVEALEGGWLRLHPLLRAALGARTAEREPGLPERVQRGLFAWWDERCRPVGVRSIVPAHELALEEAAFHRAAFERESFGDWAHARGLPFLAAARYGPVRRLWETALAVEEASLAEDDVKLARTLGNLGLVLQLLGQPDAAVVCYGRALVIRERGPDPEDPAIAVVMNNLGMALWERGDLDGALVQQEHALALAQQALGADHPAVAATLHNLGLILQARGALPAALVRCRQALALEEGALGPDHVQVGRTLLNLAEVEEQLGATPAGRAHRERSLAIFQSRLGERHPRTVAVRRSLAALAAGRAATRPRG
jgi:tetratricopeptide (TPR) repeat protein